CSRVGVGRTLTAQNRFDVW
nr:immunoglobulin heavy chain junction region [Macaca mulatta]MOW90887.1 immunoglobulin heavy chain junction region [Macaca mulatta]MOW91106.1 immunoglobulin heavy chain junction region [Macaca mulatta]